MEAVIRATIGKIGEISADAATLSADADLYDAGLSSYGTVELMIGLEQALGIEFPDTLLRRDTFTSIRSIALNLRPLVEQADRVQVMA